ADVAARSGFRHPSHFSHCFKRHYGVSPTAYRRARPR
ncbi:MAG: AraC family transcriptional regulator, partial [Armatimonadetes bacterium]|nr:AraC family transcriptional regulator [Armatimonadota bacterium]